MSTLDNLFQRWLKRNDIWFAAPVWRYGVGLPLVTAAILLRWALLPVIGEEAPYIFIFPAIIVVAVLGGLGPALMASVLGTLGTEIFFYGPLGIEAEPATALRMIMIILSGGMIGYIGYALRSLQIQTQARAEALRRQANLIDLSPDGIIVRRPDGTITFWSRGAEKLYGWTGAEAIGRKTHDILQTQFPCPLEEILQEIRRTGHWSGELVQQTRDGRKVVVQSWWMAESVGKNDEIDLLESNVDITERTQIREALEKFNEVLEQRVAKRTAELQAKVEELRRANDDLEHFAFISSHDLQEPLRMIASYVGLLAHTYKDKISPEANEYIGFAVEGAQRMSNLIKAVLEYSRVNTHRRPSKTTETQVVLDGVLKNLHLKIQETGAQITVGDLPSVWADPVQLSQVFQNLIDNALQYRKDTEPPKIHIAAESRDGQWLFSVTDNGIGIEPQYYHQIFQPFKRLHARRDRYPGTGIGLAIVKRIVEGNGGQIRVDSVPNQGSTFSFTLPNLKG
jgi:PAS domain S-box-containing protein